MKRIVACSLLTALSALTVPLTHAQSSGMGGMEMKGMDMKSDKKGKSQTHKGSGTVSKVDAAKGAITIAHGPVPSMNWPAMTMTFKVKDKKMLDKVKEGTKVDFSFVESGRDHTITEMK